MDPGGPPLFRNKDKYFNNIEAMLDGFRKKDPWVKKMLPVKVDLPELICHHGLNPLASERDKAVGNLSLIALYYILHQGKYCINAAAPDKKQTVQFRVKDITFFKRDIDGVFRQLRRDLPDWILMCEDSAAMNLSNQKNGHKNICINHASNGSEELCPVQELARRIVSIRFFGNTSIFLSSLLPKGKETRRQQEQHQHIIKTGSRCAQLPLQGYANRPNQYPFPQGRRYNGTAPQWLFGSPNNENGEVEIKHLPHGIHL